MNQDKEKIVYQGKIVEVVEKTKLINGKELHLEQARRAPGVRLIIETPEGNFILNKEHRHELNKVDIRLPGGKVFDYLEDYNEFLSKGDDIIERAKEAAKLEALQEAGVKANDLQYFATSRCGATMEWDLIYFVIKNYEKVNQELEEHEDIENIEVTPQEVKKWALSGKLQEDRSVAMILKYLYQKEIS